MRLFWPIPIILLIILLSILLTDTGLAQAQWPDFGVYHTVGTIKCVPAKGGPVQIVRKGSWVYDGDRIQLVDETADIILFTRDNNYIHLKGKGAYTTKDLQTMQRSHVSDNITARYLSLLWDELFRPGSNGETGGSAGGVSRGGSFMLSPADNYRTSLDRVLFRWQRMAAATGYRLTLYDKTAGLNGQSNPANPNPAAPVYDSTVSDTQLVVRVILPLFYGHTYDWSLEWIAPNHHRQPAANGTAVLVDEADLLPVPPSPPGIDTSLSRAQYLELIGRTRSANSFYLNLLSADPTDPALRILYREFRRRNGLD
jgi:hypothetical protein